MAKSPPYSVDLVKTLNEQYPPIRPDDNISDRELWGRIYQRRLVDSLMVLYKLNKESDTD